MFKVGLTGGIGSGKSTVARVFGVLGIPVFQADEESKRLLNEDPQVRDAVIGAFGEAMYAQGVLDRKAMAAVVFNDAGALGRLNAIAHPAVRAVFARWIDRQRSPYVFLEAALLVDTGWYRGLDHLVVVAAPEELRIARVAARDGSSRTEVLGRIRNQVSEDERLHAADSVIQNDGVEPLIPQVLALHEALLRTAAEH